MEYLNLVFLENTLRHWLLAIISGIALFLILTLLNKFLKTRFAGLAADEKLDARDLFYWVLIETRWLFLFWIAVYSASLFLVLPENIRRLLSTMTIMVVLFQAGLWVIKIIEYYVARRINGDRPDSASRQSTLNAVRILSKFVVWTVVVVLALDNIPGIEITSLIASLGIGGIAIGLAVQNILGDLFGSLTIALDKPFVVGDFINVGEFSGSVEHIGLKSTRVRSLSGELIVFSNSDLLNSRIRNFKVMERRRVIFTLGVTYQTPYEKLEMIPSMLREIIESKEYATFDRAHFKEYGDFAIIFEAVYYLETSEFSVYMDHQQSINLEIYRRFGENGIEFAYPTQTIFLNRPAA